VLGLLWLAATAQAAPSPATRLSLRPVSEYTIRPVCSSPAPGRASCLVLRVKPTPSAGVSPAVAPPLLPGELHAAYGFPADAAEPQTIALVDAYDDPHAEADLRVYDEQLGLPECTEANGCFSKLNQNGQPSPLPPENGEWSVEISADIEVAHAVCENCRIVLVEAETDLYGPLDTAEDAAAVAIEKASKPGQLEGEISNSWGGPEPEADSSAFNHPGIAITAAAGDNGYLNWRQYENRKEKESGYFPGADYPASSPHVVAVGGTSLTVGAQGEWLGENVWNDGEGAGGGGCSAIGLAPAWQPLAAGWAAVGCGAARAVADVSADADPATGVPVYDSVPEKAGEEPPGWMQLGGTSVASPIIASAFALAGGAQGVAYPAATLYAHAGTAALHDITVGGNGECDGVYARGCNGSLESPLDCGPLESICNAAPGYDGPTGVGTPIGLEAFRPVPGEVGGPSVGGNEGEGSGAPAGGGTGTASPGAQPTPQPAPPPRSVPTTAGPPRVTRLVLTLGALAALNRARPGLSAIAFTFALSASAQVRVTLARRIRVHGHWRWSALRGANTLSARAGTNRARLNGRGALPAGLYRLTLTPTHGVARSISISIG